MKDEIPSKKVIITAVGTTAVRQLAVEGILPHAAQLAWQYGGNKIHVEKTDNAAVIEIARGLFDELDRQEAWPHPLSQAFRNADAALANADAQRHWWDKCIEGLALLNFGPVAPPKIFALASVREPVKGYQGITVVVERYTP